jgi:DNA invertase Pin-like site-specific DNA recombinase
MDEKTRDIIKRTIEDYEYCDYDRTETIIEVLELGETVKNYIAQLKIANSTEQKVFEKVYLKKSIDWWREMYNADSW